MRDSSETGTMLQSGNASGQKEEEGRRGRREVKGEDYREERSEKKAKKKKGHERGKGWGGPHGRSFLSGVWQTTAGAKAQEDLPGPFMARTSKLVPSQPKGSIL